MSKLRFRYGGGETLVLHVPTHVDARIAAGRSVCQKVNQILDSQDFVRGFPKGTLKIVLHDDDDDGSWSRSMFYEFACRAREPDGPRFECGLLGTVFVDVVLKGSLVRMKIDALSVAKEGMWYVEPIPLG